MKCPKCSKEMIPKKQDFSYNFASKPKKKYIRKFYWCKKDDIWLNLEMPAK